MGTLRGKYIPESTRSAIMNFFRLPLNFFVVVLLTQVGTLANSTVFTVCVLWLIFALVLLYKFQRTSAPPHSDSSSGETEEPLIVETSGH